MYEVTRGGGGVGPRRGAKAKYPWREMEVGDRFFVEFSLREREIPAEARKCAQRVAKAAYMAGVRHGRKYKTLREMGGVRVWRKR